MELEIQKAYEEMISEREKSRGKKAYHELQRQKDETEMRTLFTETERLEKFEKIKSVRRGNITTSPKPRVFNPGNSHSSFKNRADYSLSLRVNKQDHKDIPKPKADNELMKIFEQEFLKGKEELMLAKDGETTEDKELLEYDVSLDVTQLEGSQLCQITQEKSSFLITK